MKIKLSLIKSSLLLLGLSLSLSGGAYAQTQVEENTQRNQQQLEPATDGSSRTSMHSKMVLDNDGVLQQNEYEVISTNGSITRALCPYTCEMRGVPKNHCRQWRSIQDPKKCYVQDTSLPTNAIKF